jgi:hypothetical protein
VLGLSSSEWFRNILFITAADPEFYYLWNKFVANHYPEFEREKGKEVLVMG